MAANSGLPSEGRPTCIEEVVRRVGVDPRLALAEFSFDPFTTCIVLSGSIADGFSNKGSDFDLFVIGAADGDSFHFHSSNCGKWIDGAVYDATALMDRIRRLNSRAGAPPQNWSRYAGPSVRELDVAHRLSVAIPLTSLDLPVALKGELARDDWKRELSYVFLSFARSFWSDAAGAHASRHYAQANFVCEMAYGYAIDAYSALLGETNPGEKWRWAKVARLRDDPLSLSCAATTPSVRACAPHTRTSSSEQLRETAALIFATMTLIERMPVQPLSPEDPLSRYELVDGQRVTIDFRGRIS